MHRVNERIAKRIAKQLAEFYKRRAEPDYEEQARLILLIVDQERMAEIREWREQQLGTPLPLASGATDRA